LFRCTKLNTKVNIKIKGEAVLPNLFQMLLKIEDSFSADCGEKNVFDLDVVDTCPNYFLVLHITVITYILPVIFTNYIIMKIWHYAVQTNRKEKVSKKKKLAKLQ